MFYGRGTVTGTLKLEFLELNIEPFVTGSGTSASAAVTSDDRTGTFIL